MKQTATRRACREHARPGPGAGRTGPDAARAAPGQPAGGSVYALLTDGRTAEIRPARPGDAGAVQAMHEALSPENLYLRFFTLSRGSAEQEAQRVCLLAARSRGAAGLAGRPADRRGQLRARRDGGHRRGRVRGAR